MQYIEGKTLADLIRELRLLEGGDADGLPPTVCLDDDLNMASMLMSGQFGLPQIVAGANARAASILGHAKSGEIT